MKHCENCGIVISGNEFGSGRFCSKRCASSYAANKTNKNRPISYVCEVCGKAFEKRTSIKKGRKITCDTCKNTSVHSNKELNNLLEASSRTVSKILYRMKIPCSLCGWNKASCDVHHIVPKKMGGNNSNENLIIVCPNCHREIHNDVCEYSTDELLKRSVATQWDYIKSGYHPSN